MLRKYYDKFMYVLVNNIALISVVALLMVLITLTISLHTLHENNELQSVRIHQLSADLTKLTDTVHKQQIAQHLYALQMTSELSSMSLQLSQINTQVKEQNNLIQKLIIQNHRMLRELRDLRHKIGHINY